jgi:cytochrome P450
VSDVKAVDIYTDESFVENPYPYYDELRAKCPVQHLDHLGLFAVTGYDEMMTIYRESETFSSCNAMANLFPAIEADPDSPDIGPLIEAARADSPIGKQMFTQDAPVHTAQRSLLMRLFTPKRLQQNEQFMWRLADRQIDQFIDSSRFEALWDYAKPFTVLVIADLLGVPEADHELFRQRVVGLPGGDDDPNEAMRYSMNFLEEYFVGYIEERRRAPRADIMSEMAQAKYPDGSTPEVDVVGRTAAFLFAAGGDTTARLLLSALCFLAERPDLQQSLRRDHGLIPDFIEETLRMESVVKTDFRMARRRTNVAGVDMPAGARVMLLNGAANHDPSRFENPGEFRLDRPNLREHLSFGRGPHSCPGGPLARIESRVSLERLLDRTSDIRISEADHGPPDARRYRWEPTFVLRGLSELRLEFTPAK